MACVQGPALASSWSGMPAPLPLSAGRSSCPPPTLPPRHPTGCSHLLPLGVQAGGAARPSKVDNDRGAPARAHRQAVPRAVSACRRPALPAQLPASALLLATCHWLAICHPHRLLHALPHRRWHNHLNPNIKRGQWSRQEDEVIARFHRRFGNQVRRFGGRVFDCCVYTNWETGAGGMPPA